MDKSGQPRFCGTSLLRSSQPLWLTIGSIFPNPAPIPGLPRCYPSGFGHSLKQAWEQHMATCERRELRFKPQPLGNLSAKEQFEAMPIGDLWEDSKIYEPIAYLLKSKKLRWGMMVWYGTVWLGHVETETLSQHYSTIPDSQTGLCRIPVEWKSAMRSFWDEYQQKAPTVSWSCRLIVPLVMHALMCTCCTSEAFSKPEICYEIQRILQSAECESPETM